MSIVVELLPGMAAIRKELDSLRELHALILKSYSVTENGRDVTARETRVLAVVISGLEAALADLLNGKR